MARFSCNDIDGFVLSMEEIAMLDDDAVTSILSAGAEVIRQAHVDSINRHFDKRTAKLIGSPKVHMKVGSGRNGHGAKERYALVYPAGEHHKFNAKSGGTGTATNADLGFVHEFGGHGNEAAGWMREANERDADAMVEAEEKVYDTWLKSKNL